PVSCFPFSAELAEDGLVFDGLVGHGVQLAEQGHPRDFGHVVCSSLGELLPPTRARPGASPAAGRAPDPRTNRRWGDPARSSTTAGPAPVSTVPRRVPSRSAGRPSAARRRYSFAPQ